MRPNDGMINKKPRTAGGGRKLNGILTITLSGDGSWGAEGVLTSLGHKEVSENGGVGIGR